MTTTARARVEAAYARIAEVDRPEIWIALASRESALAEADTVDARTAAGERLPLAGLIAAVKDNIDAAGFETTAGSRAYAYTPQADSTAVRRLREAGAVVIGKTNLDQFATGLVGTRSPFHAVRNAWDPERISGGSSSGSGVAVALGLVDIALGTDTAGSGRVPAALNGIVGVKPSKGRIPLTGVVPACRTLDCVSVFARELSLAERAVDLLSGPDGLDPLARARPERPASPGRGQVRRLGIPSAAQLGELAPGWAEAFDAAVADFTHNGVEIVPVDISSLLDAARMLYEGAFVAERHAAVGAFIEAHTELIGTDLDPTVAGIIRSGGTVSASALFTDLERLQRLGLIAEREVFSRVDALLTPTTTWHPTLAQVRDDPVGANSRMGRFTNFANLLDMCALAVPAGVVAGLPFGVMLTAPAGRDHDLAVAAAQMTLPPSRSSSSGRISPTSR